MCMSAATARAWLLMLEHMHPAPPRLPLSPPEVFVELDLATGWVTIRDNGRCAAAPGWLAACSAGAAPCPVPAGTSVPRPHPDACMPACAASLLPQRHPYGRAPRHRQERPGNGAHSAARRRQVWRREQRLRRVGRPARRRRVGCASAVAASSSAPRHAVGVSQLLNQCATASTAASAL